ncbi:1-acyl-sn-glycerol-3-phosphate acyltransferase [Oscillospiraceae bacterium OttesenSCG-928-G22]|nr:1-acyl-sn-glycerol-3-phosphate acyltransferase [Oscillospiraceae bacterium OttesenSCG-928-G22]
MLLYRIIYIIMWPVLHLLYRIRVVGRENIPDGPAIFCGNHTSLADPLLVAIKCRNGNGFQFPLFMAKAEIRKIPIIGFIIAPLIIFIKRGESDIAALKNAIEKLKSGRKLIMFPEGTRVSPDDAASAKTGISLISLKSGAKIVPVYLTAGRKRFFSRVTVVYGTPYLPERDKSLPAAQDYRRIADDLMERIRALAEAAK